MLKAAPCTIKVDGKQVADNQGGKSAEPCKYKLKDLQPAPSPIPRSPRTAAGQVPGSPQWRCCATCPGRSCSTASAATGLEEALVSGMGTVWRAEDLIVGYDVALKLILAL
ncbi:hypothetical protein [Streptomyces sp. NPDC057966]|uniref:hypothetical protein n=1 Tax=Streptomyces sp. NPDC057966 TaxID=3346292 RepID=UPI0036EFBB8F